MARPIAPTPQLRGKEADTFLARVEADLRKPTGPVPTPNIDKAISMVMQDARSKSNED